MTILVAILNAIKDIAKAIMAHRSETATLNAQLKAVLLGQAHLTEVAEETRATVNKIWGALELDQATKIIVPWTLEGGVTTEGENVQLTDSQKGTLGPIVITDSKGAPTTLDGAPVWATSDGTIAVIEPSEDGLSAVVKGVLPGTCKYTVTGDALVGEGTEPLIGEGTITVTPGKAIRIEVPEGPVEDQ